MQIFNKRTLISILLFYNINYSENIPFQFREKFIKNNINNTIDLNKSDKSKNNDKIPKQLINHHITTWLDWQNWLLNALGIFIFITIYLGLFMNKKYKDLGNNNQYENNLKNCNFIIKLIYNLDKTKTLISDFIQTNGINIHIHPSYKVTHINIITLFILIIFYSGIYHINYKFNYDQKWYKKPMFSFPIHLNLFFSIISIESFNFDCSKIHGNN